MFVIFCAHVKPRKYLCCSHHVYLKITVGKHSVKITTLGRAAFGISPEVNVNERRPSRPQR